MVIKTLTGAAAACVLALSFTAAGAAPLGAPGAGAATPDSLITKVHGFHQSCQKGPGGWHRHNKWGQRRPCKPWYGKGKRPNACIKVGPIFYCDY